MPSKKVITLTKGGDPTDRQLYCTNQQQQKCLRFESTQQFDQCMIQAAGNSKVVRSMTIDSSNTVNITNNAMFRSFYHNHFISELQLFQHSILSDVEIAREVMKDGRINSLGCRIPVKSNWNLRPIGGFV